MLCALICPTTLSSSVFSPVAPKSGRKHLRNHCPLSPPLLSPLTSENPNFSADRALSEMELQTMRRRAACCRGRWLERAWERRCGSPEGDLGCRILVRPRGSPDRLCMDIQEVKACKDLSLEMAYDWTVEISGAPPLPLRAVAAGARPSATGGSPVPEFILELLCSCVACDDPRDIKAKLRAWVLASSSRLSN